MRTRAEALATARANLQPGIDLSVAQVQNLSALVDERTAAVYQLPGVVAAEAQVVQWQQTYADRVNAALNAPRVLQPMENKAAALAVLDQRRANLETRLRAVNAYYDELERRAASEAVVANPPAESV